MQGWMREARQDTYLLESRQQHLAVSRHRSCAMLNSGKTLQMCGSIQGLYHATQGQQAPRDEHFLNCHQD